MSYIHVVFAGINNYYHGSICNPLTEESRRGQNKILSVYIEQLLSQHIQSISNLFRKHILLICRCNLGLYVGYPIPVSYYRRPTVRRKCLFYEYKWMNWSCIWYSVTFKTTVLNSFSSYVQWMVLTIVYDSICRYSVYRSSSQLTWWLSRWSRIRNRSASSCLR